ncbi:MAG: hypothetical protein JRI95_13365 [Deltaproteobacteria bacterium]|nr:hypothetical protein [Deltaproteobacteria bacterium]
MTLYLLTIGIVSILGQVLILRELTVAFYGIELIYILAMGIWLFWTAVGALMGRRRYVPSAAAIGSLFIVFGLLMPGEVAFIRGIRFLFGGIPGSYLPFWQQLTAITLTLLPVGILLGLLFQWAAKFYVSDDRTLAMAYAIESLGGLIGGLSSTLCLKFGIQNFTIVILCSLLSVGILFFPGQSIKTRLKYIPVLIFCMLLPVLWFSPVIDLEMTRWNHPSLIDSRDSPYSRITIAGRAGQFVVFENDVFSFETESAAAEELAHLAAVNHDQLAQVLILGGGVEGVITEILKHAPRQVDYVELNAVLLDLTRKHLPSSYQAPLESETVRIYHADPRSFLKDAKSYDLILVGMPEPNSGQSNRFYTREFFKQCAHKLKPEGVLAFRLRSSENIWTRLVTFRNTSIYLSLAPVFSDVVVLPGVTNIIIASNVSLSRDPQQLIERFNQRKIKTRLITPAYINYLYTNDRFAEIAGRLASTKAPPNTDTRPICYQYSSLIWLSKFVPRMMNWDISFWRTSASTGMIPGVLAAGCLIGLFLVVRRWARLQRIILVAMAGFIGMVLETMLILYYQVKSGVLFQNLGILLMVFMAGLAAGSILVRALTASQTAKYGFVRKSIGRSLLIGFGVLSLIFLGLSRLEYQFDILPIAFMLFVTGFLVSGVFAYASLFEVKDQKIVVSPLYAADLLGGCVGSLLGSLLLIPFLGMSQSAALAAILALLALALI